MFFYNIISLIANFFAATKSPIPRGVTQANTMFPNDFLFGATTSAYQVEGGWNVDGKGESVRDYWIHLLSDMYNETNADIGPNSYEYYLDDVTAAKNLNLDFYRFALSWSRILPTGDIANVNEKGIEYYNNIIDNLLKNNIQPMITICHIEYPRKLQMLGGFTNSVIVDYFVDYASLVFERFGDRVKYWITFNEIDVMCRIFGANTKPGSLPLRGPEAYLCAHNALKAHAAAYHVYKKRFNDRFHGQVGVTMIASGLFSDKNDAEMIDRAHRFELGWLANPIFSSKGNYPDVMISRIAKNSSNELPTFSENWIEEIRGSADFFGLNYYTSRYLEPSEYTCNSTIKNDSCSYAHDENLYHTTKPDFKPSEISCLFSYPRGLGELLRWIKKEYNNPPVFITENGWPDKGEMEDDGRIEYLREHLQTIQDAILNDGCNVKGYTIYSLIDCYEFLYEYKIKFGLYSVNMSSPRRERSPRKSTYFVKELATTHHIPNQ